ncbi:metal-dependent hydrolase [Natrinema sp. H-ect4]|uniref:metal-dependent hydrolase n=1 Tax=Natrinema sp. H-ect4 TaxID=3242699 RepID=UPI0035A89CAB
MDLLTHLFLPLAVVYVLRPKLFENPLAFGVAGFAILPDLDKLVAVPGGLHSLLTLLPIALGVVVIERWSFGQLRYSPVIVGLLYSHLLLDLVEGDLVTLLAPLVTAGLELQYSSQVVFGGEWPIMVRGELLSMVIRQPEAGAGGSGVSTYPLVRKYGVLSMLVFLAVVSPQFTHDR